MRAKLKQASSQAPNQGPVHGSSGGGKKRRRRGKRRLVWLLSPRVTRSDSDRIDQPTSRIKSKGRHRSTTPWTLRDKAIQQRLGSQFCSVGARSRAGAAGSDWRSVTSFRASSSVGGPIFDFNNACTVCQPPERMHYCGPDDRDVKLLIDECGVMVDWVFVSKVSRGIQATPLIRPPRIEESPSTPRKRSLCQIENRDASAGGSSVNDRNTTSSNQSI